ncbi:MAG: heparinase II/III family protein [Planctomycetota bacterium]|nr:heparinase II/III family protein [Planctomycetota bacterium]
MPKPKTAATDPASSPASFNPESLVPRAIPPHPRTLADAKQLARARALADSREWAKRCREELLKNANEAVDLATPLPDPPDAGANRRVVRHAVCNALAAQLTGDAAYHARGVDALRLLAHAFIAWPRGSNDAHAVGGGLGESRFNIQLGQAYDLLAVGTISPEDDRLFRDTLQLALAASDHNGHRTCGNHNTWCLAGQANLAAALGDVQRLRGILLGRPCPPRPDSSDTPSFRYGLLHMLAHDFLPDGMHWERTPGYHFYTLMGLCECLCVFANLGVDLWHAKIPAAAESDGHDLHRSYGPAGLKTIQAAFDAPFYSSFANLDMPLLHDSGLANLRGHHIWGPVYQLAWQAYGDPKYAWLLHRTEREYGPRRQTPAMPMVLQTHNREFDFVRLHDDNIPDGEFSLVPDASISLTGKHVNGCTLLPSTGVAMLRSDPADAAAPGAYLFFGPHSAGHQSPAALHLDLHAAGGRATNTPGASGYDDPKYLTWVRTTIAHNTVAVDGKPMFPCDLGGESIWEADSWRQRRSDGSLELFQPEKDFSAVRAANQNVYPGVRLDRTVVLTKRYALDVYRCFADHAHTYDWAMHAVGIPQDEPKTVPTSVGRGLGYRHLKKVRRCIVEPGEVALAWGKPWGVTRARLMLPKSGEVFLTQDPPAGEKGLGAFDEVREQAGVVVRLKGNDALFISLWWFDNAPPPTFGAILGDVRHELSIDVIETATTRWTIPIQSHRIARESR